jgi:hypothetical protein
MADYDQPVCHRCDVAREELALRQLAPSRGRLPEWAARLPLSYRTGPGRAQDITDLLDALDPDHGRAGGYASGRIRGPKSRHGNHAKNREAAA